MYRKYLILCLLASDACVASPAAADFDRDLCERAQLYLVNADSQSLAVKVMRGEGNGFHTI